MVEYEDGHKTMLTNDENERRAVAKQLLSSSLENNIKIGYNKNYQEKKVKFLKSVVEPKNLFF